KMSTMQRGSLPSSRHRSWLHSLLAAVEDWQHPDSNKNEMDMSSTSTIKGFAQTNELKPMTRRDAKKVVHDVVNSLFAKEQGHANLSSSTCSLDSELCDSLNMDPRLKLWYRTLQDRANVQAKIQHKLGRRPDEMLCNLPTTVASRDRGTVTRLLDIAGRMHPTTLVQRKPALSSAPTAVDAQQCRLPPLQETLPRAEQRGVAKVEISALTKSTKTEILGRRMKGQERPTEWLQSKVLDERITKERDNIKRVIEFFPDTENLEVVGASMQEVINTRQSSGSIERISASSVYTVSSSSGSASEEPPVEPAEPAEPEEPSNGMASDLEIPSTGPAAKLNGVLYFNKARRCPVPLLGDVCFECYPYQNVLKDVLTIDNVGRTLLTCNWILLPEVGKRCDRASVLRDRAKNTAQDNFLMGEMNFTVFPGEKHVCRVLYRPRSCKLMRLRYRLTIYPNIVGTLRGFFELRLTGRCNPSPEYSGKLKRQMEALCNKSKQIMTDTLTTCQAELVPMLLPTEVQCPYQRELDEREVFNAENPGYHCERFGDLETLKELHQKLKYPREPAWDLRIRTIRKVILRLPLVAERELYFQQLVAMQQGLMQGCAGDSKARFAEEMFATHYGRNTERNRSRFIYVRGCIGNGIQEWEEMMASIELSALKVEVTSFYAKQRDSKAFSEVEEEEEVLEKLEPKPWMRRLREEDPGEYLLRKLRARKSYRDTLYIQTYSHLCDLAETMVSVMESTQAV
ncbi:hypothetical protein KR018_010364, partial [Drosophila ironensis]